jgi:aminoglycoside phosphotransferase (APT) family kinase protein
MSRTGNDISSALGRRLGSGKDAEVFELGESVIKLYKAGVPKHTAFREAAALAQAEAMGLPVPRVDDVRQIDGRWGVVMDRVDGYSFAEIIDAHPAEEAAHLKEMASLHRRIHACEAVFFGSLKAKLEANIRRTTALSEGRQRKLLEVLAGLPDGDRLCHGDFHPWNVLGSPSRSSVIDWTSAARGSPAADVCRSYVLITPSALDRAASYVEAYAELSGGSLEDIFRWLPVVAAARLAEGVPDEVAGLMAMLERGGQAGTT